MLVTDELMKIFGTMAEQKQSVRLINTYRGIPITHDALVLDASQGYMTLQVHDHQAVCLALEGKTYIQGSTLPEVLQARFMGVDILQKQVTVTEFLGVGTSIGRRMAVRVQPKEPTDVEIYDGSRRIPGKLADISTVGVGVFTFATYIYGSLPLNKSATVFVDVRLGGSEQILRFIGKISSVVHQKGTFMHRLGIKLQPNPAIEPFLSEYVHARQDEALRELQGIYETMCRERQKMG